MTKKEETRLQLTDLDANDAPTGGLIGLLLPAVQKIRMKDLYVTS